MSVILFSLAGKRKCNYKYYALKFTPATTNPLLLQKTAWFFSCVAEQQRKLPAVAGLTHKIKQPRGQANI